MLKKFITSGEQYQSGDHDVDSTMYLNYHGSTAIPGFLFSLLIVEGYS